MSNVINFECKDCKVIEILHSTIIVDEAIIKTEQELADEKANKTVTRDDFQRITVRVLKLDAISKISVGDNVNLEYSQVCIDGKFSNILKSITKL